MAKPPVRLELSCEHIISIPRKLYNRELGVVWCGKCGKPRDLGQAYVLPDKEAED